MSGRFETVLVVDDDERLLSVFVRQLRRGHKVLMATNTADALGLARRDTPDLAVIDLQLGCESGIDLIRTLKRELPATTAVLMSGYASVQATVLAMRAGAHDVFVKPITWREILQRLDHDDARTEAIETPTLARAEWEHVHRVLFDCDGNISMAARRLGMYRSTLQRWLRRHAPIA